MRLPSGVLLLLVACGGKAADTTTTPSAAADSCPPFQEGTVTTLATGVTAGGVVATPSGVYWAADGTVFGASGNIVATLRTATSSVTADVTSIYSGTANGIVRLPLDGGAPTTLATGDTAVSDLAVDATTIYWASTGLSMEGPSPVNGLFSEPLAGGAISTLVPMDDFGGHLDGVPIALDDADLYWLDDDNDGGLVSVRRVPKGGGAITTFVSPTNTVSHSELVLDSTHVYVIGTAGSLLAFPKAGGPPATIATGVSGAFAVDECNAYWATGGLGDTLLLQTPLAGGDVYTLAVSENDTTGPILAIATDATSVYWTTQGPIWDPSHNPSVPAGSVERLTPK